MSAAGHHLDNLCLIIDRNFMQVEGHTDKVMSMEPVAAKWAAFGWHVLEIDGNSMAEIIDSLHQARQNQAQPSCVIAKTLPGKGVPFLEHQMSHLAAITQADADRALQILGDPSS
jgi:transketolase